MVSDTLKPSYNKEYYQKNKDRLKANYKRYYDKYQDIIAIRNKGYKLKWKYGITKEDLENLKRKQNNQCAICTLEKPLVIDHNHDTGQVRGLLCHSCNKGLGHFFDNTYSISNAFTYLNKENI